MLFLKNYKFDTYETLTYIFKRLVLFKNDIDFILLAPSNRNDTNFSAELVNAAIVLEMFDDLRYLA